MASGPYAALALGCRPYGAATVLVIWNTSKIVLVCRLPELRPQFAPARNDKTRQQLSATGLVLTIRVAGERRVALDQQTLT